MAYHFDLVQDRRNTGSVKWDVPQGALPMSLADMDFQAAPEILEAFRRRVDNGIFGYGMIPDAWYAAYQGWWKTRHHLDVEHDWLIFCTGVVPALSSVVRKLTTPAEKVLIQTPVYNIFFNSILNNGRQALECPLVDNGETYDIDFAALERNLADPQTTMMILCNPHNPVGRLWDRETLARIGELCAKHHVVVVSDEIHCDLTDPGKEYVPFAAASETCKRISVTCIAPTKAFNLAGLQTAAVMVPNPVLRHKVWRSLNTDEVAEPNAFAVEAAIAAFTKSAGWLDELRDYLYQNKQLVRETVRQSLPQLTVRPSEATYLLWLDCTALRAPAAQIAQALQEYAGLYLSAGAQYGKGGEHFLRMNIACPRSVLIDGLNRLKKGMDAYLSRKP